MASAITLPPHLRGGGRGAGEAHPNRLGHWLVAVAAAVAPAAITSAAIAPTEAALSRSGRYRQGGGHHLGVDLLVDRLALRRQLFDRRLPAQVQPALAVDLDSLDDDLVADVDNLLHALDAVV